MEFESNAKKADPVLSADPVLRIWHQYEVHLKSSLVQTESDKRRHTGYLRKVLAAKTKTDMRGMRVGAAKPGEGSVIVSFNDASRSAIDAEMKKINSIDRVECLRWLALVV